MPEDKRGFGSHVRRAPGPGRAPTEHWDLRGSFDIEIQSQLADPNVQSEFARDEVQSAVTMNVH